MATGVLYMHKATKMSGLFNVCCSSVKLSTMFYSAPVTWSLVMNLEMDNFWYIGMP